MLQDAFAEVRPTIVFAVPLIIEKIYEEGAAPHPEQLLLRSAVKLPLLRRVVYRKAVDALTRPSAAGSASWGSAAPRCPRMSRGSCASAASPTRSATA